MPRLFLSLFIVFVACLAGCGLNEREQAVAAANDAIHHVEEAGLVVAEAIDELPDRALETDDFGVVRSSLRTYVERMELLNAALRELGGRFAPLDPYLTGTFRPAAEAAATSCQEALDTLDDEASDQEAFARALTRIGLCLERYSTAVTNVAAEYGRLSG